MIKVGMNLLLWSDNPSFATHAQLLDKCKRIGYEGVEFNVGLVSDLEECRKFGEHARKLGLDVTTVGVFSPAECNPISPDPAMREATYQVFKNYIDRTLAFGGKLICGPLFQALGYFSGERPTKQEWDWSIQTMRPCFEYALEKGVTVAVEPLNRFEVHLLNTIADAIEYVKEINLPNVGLLIDTMHANIEELNVAASFKKALPYTKHVHISENDRGIPGTGHACGQEIFDVFKNSDYKGYLTIEAFNMGAPSFTGALHLWRTFAPSDDQLAEQGHDYIRKCMA